MSTSENINREIAKILDFFVNLEVKSFITKNRRNPTKEEREKIVNEVTEQKLSNVFKQSQNPQQKPQEKPQNNPQDNQSNDDELLLKLSEKCKEQGKALNIKSKRCVGIDTRTYKDALKYGYIYDETLSVSRSTDTKSKTKPVKSSVIVEKETSQKKIKSDDQDDSYLEQLSNKCKEKGKFLNIESKRCIGSGTRTYNDAVKNGKIYGISSDEEDKEVSTQEKVVTSKTQQTKDCPEGKIRSPESKKCITIGGAVYNSLVLRKKIDDAEAFDKLSSETSETPKKTQNKKQNKKSDDDSSTKQEPEKTIECPEGKILNPVSGKCVTIGGTIHKKMMKEQEKLKAGERDVSEVNFSQGKNRARFTPVKYKRGNKYIPRYDQENPGNNITDMCIKRSKVPLKQIQIDAIKYLNENPSLLAIWGTGMGKTLLAVGASQCYLEQYPESEVIVVTPASLVINFKNGLDQYGAKNDGKYKIFSFEGFIKEITERELSLKDKMLIIDEAHNLRTPNRAKTNAVNKAAYEARKRLIMTATPFVNQVYDIVPLINFLYGYDIVDTASANLPFVIPKRMAGSERYNKTDIKTLEELLRGKISYAQIGKSTDYPDKTEKYEPIEQDPEYYQKGIKLLQGEKIDEFGFSNPQAFYNAARRIVNATGENDFSKKMPKVVEIILDPKNVSQRLMTGTKLKGRVLIYTNFISMGTTILQKVFNENNIKFGIITGSLSAVKKQETINQFNTGKIRVLVITKSGSEGIDLKEVRRVIIMEPPWSQTEIEQITGRAIRYKSHEILIPEHRNVKIYYFVSSPPPGETKRTGDQILYSIIDSKSKFLTEMKPVLENLSVTKQ